MKNVKKAVKKEYSAFALVVRKVVAKIPKGTVLTYQEVAKKAGFPGASRAVGSVMRGNFDLEVPCHRVVRSDGMIGQYNRGGSAKKMKILQSEGAKVVNGRVVLAKRG